MEVILLTLSRRLLKRPQRSTSMIVGQRLRSFCSRAKKPLQNQGNRCENGPDSIGRSSGRDVSPKSGGTTGAEQEPLGDS